MTAAGPGARVRPLFERSASGRPQGTPVSPALHGDRDRDGAPRPRPLFEAEEAPGGKDPDEPLPGHHAPSRAAAALLFADGAEDAEAAEPPPPEDGEAAEGLDLFGAAEPRDAEAPVPVIDPYAELRAAQAEAEEARDKYLHSLQELERVHALDFSALEHDMADVALEIARAILMRELKTDRMYVVRLVEAALKVTVEDEAASVLVSPQDLARVEQERPRLEATRGGGLIRVSADPALHPGDCLVQVGRARIDARLPDRIERVRQALHGVVTETE